MPPPEPLDVLEENRRHAGASRDDEGLEGCRPLVIEGPDCRRTGEEQELRRAVSPIGRKWRLLQVGCRAERRRTRPADEEGDMGDAQRPREFVSSDPLLLTPEEAAEVLRVGRTTIYALMKAGELRPVHIGRSCRLSRDELERFVRRLEAPRAPRRTRTSTNQRAIFELGPESPDAA
jgi:excisionase family DNA binding protein